jgi:AraC-like DNA-binding protein
MTDQSDTTDRDRRTAEKDPDDWTTGDEPMTGAQKSYLQTLAQEAGEQVPDELSKADASKRIDELQSRTGRGTSGPRPAPRGTIAQVTSRPTAAQHLRDLALLRRVRDRIDREYATPLNVEALARAVHMSAGHLSREFRRAYGESPYSYLMTRRIERAMTLLRRGDLSVTEVCFAVGCSSLGTFSSRFTELVGVPPSTYRRDAARAAAGIPPCVAKQVTRPVRNREAPAREPHLA